MSLGLTTPPGGAKYIHDAEPNFPEFDFYLWYDLPATTIQRLSQAV